LRLGRCALTPGGAHQTPLSSWRVLPALRVPATQAVETVGPHRRCGGLAGWSCVVASLEGGVLVSRFFRWLSGRRLGRAMCCLRRGSLSCLLVCLELLNTATMLVSILDTMFCLAWQFSRPSCMSSCGITFADAWGPKPMLFLP